MSGSAGAVGGAPTNSAGGGQIAGIGVGKQGEPGVDLKKKKNPILIAKLARRKLWIQKKQ